MTIHVGVDAHSLSGHPIQMPGLYTLQLCSQLSKIKGVKLTVIRRHQRMDTKICDHASEIFVPKIPVVSQAYLVGTGLDIVHVNGIPGRLKSALLHARVPGGYRMVATVHGNAHFFPNLPGAPTPLMCRYQIIIQRISAHFIHHIIAISSFVKNTLISELKIPAHKISVVPYGVSDDFRPRNSKEVESVLSDFGIERPYIFHVGNNHPDKNLITLLKAFSKLAHNGFPHLLVIAGFDGDVLEIQEVMNSLDLFSSVIFLGYVAQSKLPMLYSGAELLVVPSFRETFSMPLVEAMSCGCPIVATNVGAIPEVLDGAGLLVTRPEDERELSIKMKQIILNSQLRADLVRCGIARSANFSWGKCLQETFKIYKNLQ